jgi:serine/threonine-protein kinase
MVALKFLRPEALAHPDLVERFAREARAAAKIRSEHVANVFDVGTLPDGTPYIVMEHLAGRDLADYLHQEGALPIGVAVEYIMQACEALAAAHAHGIVHRDIKPENIFLTRQARGMEIIKVLDFGISKVALPRGKRDLVRTQMALGSPVYMSPEQIRHTEHVDARSDIWAVGCVLFELLTGVTAFDEPSLLELSAAILEREPVPLLTLRPDASQELEDVVLRCLAKNPDDRYQNVAELAIALFPFAPRRARISAERCYHMLKNAGVVQSELELTSVHPPSLTAGHVTTPSLTIQRTTTPAALDIHVDASVEDFRPRRSRALWFVGLGLVAAAAGGLFVARTQAHQSPQVSAGPQRGTELPVPPVAPNTPTRVLDVDAELAAQGSSSAAPTARSASAPRSGKSTARPVARPSRPVAPAAKRVRGNDDDLDPGF